ncbi:hypothetical protein SDC9_118152 [bioreactor metagenome]|uniref:Uncharacterized protein n=1 Tax=bioreactor metagenome TaxID=1076179 RepID=A0A645C0N6_9ZZZZ
MLHGLQNLRLVQQKAAAAQCLRPLLRQSLRGHVPLLRQNLIPGREIQHSGGNHLPPKIGAALIFQREQVQQHLDVQSHADLRQVEGLLPGFVIHHPEVEPAVLQPAVYPVHLPVYPQLPVRFRYGDGGQRPLVPKGQLKFHRHKVRLRQLPRRFFHHGIGRGSQP